MEKNLIFVIMVAFWAQSSAMELENSNKKQKKEDVGEYLWPRLVKLSEQGNAAHLGNALVAIAKGEEINDTIGLKFRLQQLGFLSDNNILRPDYAAFITNCNKFDPLTLSYSFQHPETNQRVEYFALPTGFENLAQELDDEK